MIIKGNFIYTVSLNHMEIKEQQFLHVQDGLVQGFYEKLPPELSQEEVADYGNAIIIPAFYDLHIHASQYLNRGIGYDKELLPWLETYTFPVEKKFENIAFAEKAYKLFLNRLWSVGTMGFSAFATIHSSATWKFMQLTEASGLRAFIGKVNMDRNAPDYLMENTEQSLAEAEELLVKCQEELTRVSYILTPRFVPSTTGEMMRGLGKLRDKYNLPVQSHLSENRDEVAWVRSLHPDIDSYTQVYEKYGLLPENQTIMAHAIYLSNQEQAILRGRNVFLAHCAQSNANLTSGIMPLRKYLEQDCSCVIASDVAGGHSLAMNSNMATTIETSKLNQLTHQDQKAISLSEVLYLATKKPGEFFGKVGSFEPGYEFDALVIVMDELGQLLPRTPLEKLEQFVYAGDDRNITARYCRGQLVEKPFEV